MSYREKESVSSSPVTDPRLQPVAEAIDENYELEDYLPVYGKDGNIVTSVAAEEALKAADANDPLRNPTEALVEQVAESLYNSEPRMSPSFASWTDDSVSTGTKSVYRDRAREVIGLITGVELSEPTDA